MRMCIAKDKHALNLNLDFLHHLLPSFHLPLAFVCTCACVVLVSLCGRVLAFSLPGGSFPAAAVG